jgi:hypothetical protein
MSIRTLLLSVALAVGFSHTGLAQTAPAPAPAAPPSPDMATAAPPPVEEEPHAPLFCTVTSANICKGASCSKTETFGDLKLPVKLLIHFESRVIASTSQDGFPHLSPIADLAKVGDSLVLNGIDGVGWMIHVSTTNPQMSFAIATNEAVLTGIGTCEAASK